MKKQAEKEVGEYAEFAERIEQALAYMLPARTKPYSIQEKADALNQSKSFMADILKGKKMPGAPNLMEIAIRTGVRVEWLWTGRGPMTDKIAEGYIYVGNLKTEQQSAIKTVLESYKKPT